MKLISMTAFVQQYLKGKVLYHHLEKVVNYSDFLIQILELWMFVPCKLIDGVWVVLEEPSGYDLWISGIVSDMPEFKEYQEAKERCLFEGFEFKGETDFSWIFKHGKTYPVMISKRNIEYLVTIFNREIELTPAAQKQIGL